MQRKKIWKWIRLKKKKKVLLSPKSSSLELININSLSDTLSESLSCVYEAGSLSVSILQMRKPRPPPRAHADQLVCSRAGVRAQAIWPQGVYSSTQQHALMLFFFLIFHWDHILVWSLLYSPKNMPGMFSCHYIEIYLLLKKYYPFVWRYYHWLLFKSLPASCYCKWHGDKHPCAWSL